MTGRRAFSMVAFLGFFTSLVVHLTTFLGIDPARHVPGVWGLHLAIFVMFIPVLFAQGMPPKGDFLSQLFAPLPRRARYLLTAFFVYAIINFALFFALSEGGVPEVRDRKYVLNSHGTVIRELSKEEYELQEAYVSRAFSGHWMFFYLLPALCYWYPKNETKALSTD